MTKGDTIFALRGGFSALAVHTAMAISASVALLTAYPSPGFGQAVAEPPPRDRTAMQFLSGTGNRVYLGAAVVLPLLADGAEGKNHALRTLDALGTSALFSEGLKYVTRDRRPDGSNRASFPSGHATAAFAVATMQSRFHPDQAPFWYLGASLISYSRVRLHRHYAHDVLAGAVLGYSVARWELSRPHGLLVFPFLSSRERSGGFGLYIRQPF